MQTYSEYHILTGVLTGRFFTLPHEFDISDSVADGCSLVAGAYDHHRGVIDHETGSYISLDEQALDRYEDPPALAELPHMRWNVLTGEWEDVRTLEMMREHKWEEVKLARRAAIEAGFEHGGHTFQADPISLQNIIGATLAALIAQQAQQPFAVDWTAADNTVVSLDAAAAIALGLAAVAHVSAAYGHGVALREAIALAASPGELELITW